MMMKRWVSLLVENEIGVLARISSLFSSKSYNLNSLTVGVTEDDSISRMTISLTSDDQTFEQIKKQLNRSVEVIKVIDFTDRAFYMKELMFIKISECTQQDMVELTHIAAVFAIKVIDYDTDTTLIECVQTENRNNDLIRLFEKTFSNRFTVVRGGSVAVEGITLAKC